MARGPPSGMWLSLTEVVGLTVHLCCSWLAVAALSCRVYRPRMAEPLELTATAIASDGLAVSRLPSGQVVFLAGALPGEEVVATVVDERRRYLTARVTRVVRSAAARVESSLWARHGRVRRLPVAARRRGRPGGVEAADADRHHQADRSDGMPGAVGNGPVAAVELPHVAAGHRRGRSGRTAARPFERRHTRAGLPGGAPAPGRVAARTSLPRSARGAAPLRGPYRAAAGVGPAPPCCRGRPRRCQVRLGARAGRRANVAGVGRFVLPVPT